MGGRGQDEKTTRELGTGRGLWRGEQVFLLEEQRDLPGPAGPPTAGVRGKDTSWRRHDCGGASGGWAGSGEGRPLEALQGVVRVTALALHQGLAKAAGVHIGLTATVFTDVICGVSGGDKGVGDPQDRGKEKHVFREVPKHEQAWAPAGVNLVLPGSH